MASKRPHKRRFVRDLKTESVIVTDETGVHHFAIADLPSPMVTYCILLGVATLLWRSKDTTTAWYGMKRGKLDPSLGYAAERRKPPPRKPSPPKPPRKPQKLGLIGRAIVEAMLATDGCQLTREQCENRFRSMDQPTKDLWRRQPEVILHKRRLQGDKLLHLSDMLTDK